MVGCGSSGAARDSLPSSVEVASSSCKAITATWGFHSDPCCGSRSRASRNSERAMTLSPRTEHIVAAVTKLFPFLNVCADSRRMATAKLKLLAVSYFVPLPPDVTPLVSSDPAPNLLLALLMTDVPATTGFGLPAAISAVLLLSYVAPKIVAANQEKADWHGKSHFFAIGAQAMRRILVDHARARGRDKRGGDRRQVVLPEDMAGREWNDPDLLDLEAALQKMERLDPRQARVVELRSCTHMRSAASTMMWKYAGTLLG